MSTVSINEFALYSVAVNRALGIVAGCAKNSNLGKIAFKRAKTPNFHLKNV